MKYYVIYQDYTEYNQFEGDWSTQFKTFNSCKEAEKWIKDVRSNSDIKDVIGPLTRVVKAMVQKPSLPPNQLLTEGAWKMETKSC
jgi:hypothetical protein